MKHNLNIYIYIYLETTQQNKSNGISQLYYTKYVRLDFGNDVIYLILLSDTSLDLFSWGDFKYINIFIIIL